MTQAEKLTYEQAVDFLALHYVQTDWSYKDVAAAKRMGITELNAVKEYVIRGMDPKLVVLAAAAGKKMKADGLKFQITSGFRDDYRQGLITAGTRANVGYSYHGGSRVTGGYGSGKAFDINGAAAQTWIDRNGAQFGLTRPYFGTIDPPHVAIASSNEAYNRADRRGGMSPSAVDVIYQKYVANTVAIR